MDQSKKSSRVSVALRNGIDCTSCGGPTRGAAICGSCVEAITELRALTLDFQVESRIKGLYLRARPLASQGSGIPGHGP